jgi:uncharacterized protein (TIGR02757 family)
MTDGLERLQLMYDTRRAGGSLKDFHLSDPIGFPKRYTETKDVETAALVAALFAIGPRYAILRSLEKIFSELGGSPYESIMHFDHAAMLKRMKGHVQFAYKNITARDFVQILHAVKSVLNTRGTVGEALKFHADCGGKTSYSILTGFLEEMKSVRVPRSLGGALTPRARALLASPREGSACKRMNMFLRWMTRKDEIDFGFYDWLGTDKLIIPLDVNVSRAARKLNLTKRKTDNWKTAAEITDMLKTLDPADPVKYDVPLFLYGIDLRKKKRAE